MACGITRGVSITCDQLKRAGGLGKKVWGFNLTDLRRSIDTSLENYITSIELTTYVTMYAFESGKFSHEYSVTQNVGEGGNVSFQHQLILRIPLTNPTAVASAEDLATSDTVWVIQTNNNEFKILGAGAGLTSSALTDGSGRQVTDSSIATITLTGVERFMPKFFSRDASGTDTSEVLAYLNAHVA